MGNQPLEKDTVSLLDGSILVSPIMYSLPGILLRRVSNKNSTPTPSSEQVQIRKKRIKKKQKQTVVWSTHHSHPSSIKVSRESMSPLARKFITTSVLEHFASPFTSKVTCKALEFRQAPKTVPSFHWPFLLDTWTFRGQKNEALAKKHAFLAVVVNTIF